MNNISIVKEADIFLIKNYLSDQECLNLTNLLNRDDKFRMYKLFFYDRLTKNITVVNNHRKSYWLGEYAQSVQTPNRFITVGSEKILIPTDYVTPFNFPEEISKIKQNIEEEFGCNFNSCLVGKYDSPSNKIGYHSDSSANLGDDPQIASLSLGHRREFFIKHKDNKEYVKIILNSGDLLIMKNGANKNYLHAVPIDKSSNSENFRINLTFRDYSYFPEEMEICAAEF